jgi:hypothetical protein
VYPLNTSQKDFLIDTIMLEGRPRASWKGEWDDYREVAASVLAGNTKDPRYDDRYNTVRWRMQLLMRYLLKMAEHHVF